MEPPPEDTAVGRGHFRFLGPGGTYGDVDLVLTCRRSGPPSVVVTWDAGAGVPDAARREIVDCAGDYLRSYLARFPVGALRVTIAGASWDPGRRNEPDRAAIWATHRAIVDAGLPPPPIFAPPDDDDEDVP